MKIPSAWQLSFILWGCGVPLLSLTRVRSTGLYSSTFKVGEPMVIAIDIGSAHDQFVVRLWSLYIEESGSTACYGHQRKVFALELCQSARLKSIALKVVIFLSFVIYFIACNPRYARNTFNLFYKDGILN